MARSENEPANSSSGESEESLSESETDKTSTPPPTSKITQPPSSSSSDESGSESESDTGKTPNKPQSPDLSIKPLASKPSDSKKSPSKHPSTPPPLTGKRPAAEGDGGDVKRAKKAIVVAVAAPDAEICAEKKQLFQRLWSKDNEIELIQGMIDYVEEKGKNPLVDVIDFYEFVKKSLHIDVNDKQVLAKARRLKKKFKNNAARVEKNGKFRSLSNPHEKKMYELSKTLWGNDGNKNVDNKKVKVKVNATTKINKSCKSVDSGNGSVPVEVNVNANEVEPKVVQPVRSGHMDHLGSIGLPITDEVIMKKGLELLSGSKRVEMEEKWKNLKMLELEHFLKKVDVLKEQAEIVLNAIVKCGAK